MNASEIIELLSARKVSPANSFDVLREISNNVNNESREEIGRELVIRALENRDCFQEQSGILDSLVRHVGLFPYLDPDNLNFRDNLAYEFYRAPNVKDELVFHRLQAEIYYRLLSGENIILSAPTSFGKSRIIDAIIATNKYKNIAVIVPTIALIDETRRRLSAYSDSYKIITQISQEPQDSNVFVFTAERLNVFKELPEIDFFVIDEFYKIDTLEEDESRTVALNRAFYSLSKKGGQFFLLGPNVEQIPKDFEEALNCSFYKTDFSTVACELIEIFEWKDEIEKLKELSSEIDGPTLIFCRSPKRVNDVARALIECHKENGVGRLEKAVNWISEQFHPDWVLPAALSVGVGMHHGRLPRSLAQYVVRSFNCGQLDYLVCTSTMIEGVNTRAKNVIVLDETINRRAYDYFTFNNIRGRGGRMFEHFIGKVYMFHPPPEIKLPFVDFPLFSQDDNAPESLLIQLDEEDLSPKSVDRLAHIRQQDLLPLSVLKRNEGVDPEAQLNLAIELSEMSEGEAAGLFWTGIPSYKELNAVCNLIWKYFYHGYKSGVISGSQLTYKTQSLMYNPDIRSRILDELKPGRYAAKTPDEAVERVLDFDRSWANYELPKMLMVVSDIQEAVFKRIFRKHGNYSFFAARVESLFLNPAAIALEEYGLPIQISAQLDRIFPLGDKLDIALSLVRQLPALELPLEEFEQELLIDVQRYI